jgi:hypothetical protein
VLVCSTAYGQKEAKSIPVSMPSVMLVDINGNGTNLLELAKGKITFIDFWFIPCGPVIYIPLIAGPAHLLICYLAYDKILANKNFRSTCNPYLFAGVPFLAQLALLSVPAFTATALVAQAIELISDHILLIGAFILICTLEFFIILWRYSKYLDKNK